MKRYFRQWQKKSTSRWNHEIGGIWLIYGTKRLKPNRIHRQWILNWSQHTWNTKAKNKHTHTKRLLATTTTTTTRNLTPTLTYTQYQSSFCAIRLPIVLQPRLLQLITHSHSALKWYISARILSWRQNSKIEMHNGREKNTTATTKLTVTWYNVSCVWAVNSDTKHSLTTPNNPSFALHIHTWRARKVKSKKKKQWIQESEVRW